MDISEQTCKSRGFKALLATQFLGALNDNIFKLVVTLMAIEVFVTKTGGAGYISLAGALFILPFMLFAPLAGFLSDRFSKAAIIRVAKFIEIALMIAGGICMYNATVLGLLVVLFLMGLQSTLFSPAKYGILPEMLISDELSRGNGFIQFWTFTAILIGTAIGGPLMEIADPRKITIAVAVVVIAVIGFLTSLSVTRVAAASPEKRLELNGVKLLFTTLKTMSQQRELFLAVAAAAFFWFVGALIQLNTLLYAAQILQVGNIQMGLLLTALAVGIGLGSLIAGKLSAQKVELGLVPLGALGLALCSLGLGLIRESYITALVWMFGLGLSGGFYIVPINAFIQKMSPTEVRGSFLAAASFVTSGAMVLASVTLWVLKDPLSLSAAQLYLFISFLSIVAMVIIVKVMPAMFVRCLNLIITNTLYRLKVIGKDSIPATGGALLVCNHVSYVDPAFLLASIERPIRFIMLRPIYETIWINPVAKAMNCIPISSKDSPQQIVEALKTARDAVKNGELVCIFAEGALTRTGQMLSFKKGLERIMKGVDAPVIPMHLDRVWGSIFSYKRGKFFWKKPEELPYPVTVSFGKPLAGTSKAHEIRRAILELSADAFKYRKTVHKLLHIGFIHQAKKRLLHRCMSDTTGVSVSYAKALIGALALSKKFKALPSPTRMVGVLLPASVAGALTNVALIIAGKIPVNLNFTASRESIESVKAQCNLECIITSEKFLKIIGMQRTEDMCMLETVKASIGTLTRLSCTAAVFCLPVSWLKHLVFREKATPDDLATVMFSSGSTGEPKGVMLTHANIASNIEAVYEVYQIHQKDVFAGVLPFFHSFGFTGTLWFPLLAGASVVYHPNPLDAVTIGKLIEENKGTILMSTPTFLMAYIRKCSPGQFKSLRYVIVGAEKLREGIAAAFLKKFNIQPLEGYGATELSPIAAVNVPDYQNDAMLQVGFKSGTIGHPLPGVSVKVVDPQTEEPLGPEKEGLLLIKGPNVMRGYLNNPKKTQEVLKDGWYNTGDIARYDDDGFLTITDRLSRFSKIGGEMVPHIKIEEALQQALNETDRVCVVTSVADEKKGEKLIVLHIKDLNAQTLRDHLIADGLPSLWIPKPESFRRIDAFPLLGSGKLDLTEIKRLAQQFQGNV